MAEEKINVPAIVKDISDTVMARIDDLASKNQLVLPEGYSAGTALRSAFLKIQDTQDKNGKTALETCTKASVTNALLNMCIQGLQPAKNQCYFVVYGNNLQMQRSYFGTQAALKSAVPSVFKIVCEIGRQGDNMEWGMTEFGERYIRCITSTPFENINKPFAFGFCTIYDNQGNVLGATYMTWDEIQKSWRQSRNYGGESSVHKKFPEEMAKRTLINRACKNLLNSSLDPDRMAIIEAFNRTTESEFKDDAQAQEESKETPKTTAEKIKAQFNLDPKENKAEEPAKPSEETGLSEDAEDLEKELAMAEDPLNTEELF